jgi:hypothetical protein
LGLIEATLIALLLWPLPTHAVLYDAAGGAPALGQDAMTIGAIALMASAVAIPVWIAYLVIQGRKKSNRDTT